MAARFTDRDIEKLILEPKHLPESFRAKIRLREKRGHKERELDVLGAAGAQFRLILRLNQFNALDFSVILAYIPPNSNQLFRLRRYNGKSHEHTNQIEGETFYNFHIHYATERYQEIGAREDAFAVPTTRYADLYGALHCLIADCSFIAAENDQLEFPGDFDA